MNIEEFNVSKVVRRGFWLYVNNVVSNLSGFAYWFVISAIAGAEVLGFQAPS